MNDSLSRRDFVKRSGLVGAGIAAAQMLPLRFLQAQEIPDIGNPLALYPNRDWEKIYRNQYAYDNQFSWVCAPNDTHNCRITAHVRNGVIIRMGEEYDIGQATRTCTATRRRRLGQSSLRARATRSIAFSTGRID
jgi:anaerobic selenocysteine-containing dehydrogenase